MTYRLEVDGASAATRIIDERTGEDVTTRSGATSMRVSLEPDAAPRLSVEAFVRARITGISSAEWYAKDPRTGRSARLAALVFADGFVADLSGSPEQAFGGRPPGPAEAGRAD